MTKMYNPFDEPEVCEATKEIEYWEDSALLQCERVSGHDGMHQDRDAHWFDSGNVIYDEPAKNAVPGRVQFEGGGMRDTQTGKPRFDLLLPEGVPFENQYLTRVARLMAKGADHYEDRNWEKFGDLEALNRAKSSAFRHFMQWITGETDEDHAASIFFNVMAAEYIKEKISE